MPETSLSQTIRRLFEATLDKAGEDLLKALVDTVRASLGVDWVYLAGLSAPGRLEVRYGAGPDGPMAPVEYEVSGTPCEAVLQGSPCSFADGVTQHFPHSPIVQAIGARGYCGQPVLGAKGSIVAVLAAAHGGPLADETEIETVLKLAALRIGTELEREFVERRARQHQRMESLGMLAGTVAHDFNNLLTAILANVSLARMQLEATPAPGVNELLDEIESAGKQASGLTRQLISYAGRTKRERGPVDFGALVRETCRLVEPLLPPNVRVNFVPPPRRLVVQGDMTQLRQVVLSLLRNSIDAMAGRQGGITVTLAESIGHGPIHEPISWESPDFQHDAPQAALTVHDDGCGISVDLQDRIFAPLVSTKKKGQGFGLAVSASIVSKHGGAISLQSTPGVGTTAMLYLPLFAQAAETKRPDPFAGTKVLLADDEDVVRNLLARSLRSLGCEVVEAKDGAEALRILREQQTSLHCAILDVFMPRISGDAIASMLRSESQTVPVVLSSGMLPEDLAEHLRSGTVAAAVQKPCTTADLEQALRAALPAQGGR